MLKQVKAPEYEGLSAGRSLLVMWQKEGMFGLLKGNGVNVVRIAPFTAFEMFFYDYYKENLFGGVGATASAKLVCGGLTGMTASTLTYPLDLIRTVLGVKVDGDASKAQSIFGCGKQIYMRDGIKGLFRGWPTTMLVSTIVGVILGDHTLRWN
jgi:solute carrier family 25 phosphate transporter 23/24/25/41